MRWSSPSSTRIIAGRRSAAASPAGTRCRAPGALSIVDARRRSGARARACPARRRRWRASKASGGAPTPSSRTRDAQRARRRAVDADADARRPAHGGRRCCSISWKMRNTAIAGRLGQLDAGARRRMCQSQRELGRLRRTRCACHSSAAHRPWWSRMLGRRSVMMRPTLSTALSISRLMLLALAAHARRACPRRPRAARLLLAQALVRAS